MHVLLTSHHAPPHIGGVENVVLAEARALVAAGHRVTWITSDGRGAGEVPATDEQLSIVRVRACHAPERWFGIAYPLFAPSLVWHLWRAVRAADAVHVHGLVFPASPLALLFARLRGRFAVCTDHGGLLTYRLGIGTLVLRCLFATVGRLSARCADRLVALNGDLEQLLRRLGGDAGKVVFAANPVDLVRFRPPTADERRRARAELGWDDEPRVLLTGRLLPHKGIDVLLDAIAPGYRVVFCGPADAAIAERIRARGAELLAPRAFSAMPSLYHAADVLALPSRNEGFPLTVQEALACGLPVLTSDAPAYAPYRGTPGLHLVSPTAAAVRAGLQQILAARSTATTNQAAAAAQAPRDALLAAAPWLALLRPATERPPVRWPWLAMLAAALLLLHFVFTAVRWPVGVIGKRASSIASYRQDGRTAWPLRHYDDETRRIAAWLAASVPAGRSVLVRGHWPGALQLLAPMLYPRLLVDVDLLGARQPPHPPFTDRNGAVLVVVGSVDGLRLEWR